MNRKILAITFVLTFLATAVVSAAEPRWQKIINANEYRYYFDTLTISYGKTAPKSTRDEVKIDKNVIKFYAQEVYVNPQDIAEKLQQINNSVNWGSVAYSVEACEYDVKNKKICQKDISFFDTNGTYIGTVTRNTWHNIVPGSDEETIYNYIIQYAKDHNKELKQRS
ncbi:hypothetical protein [Pectinatus cerevisiiphilus]|uniref:Uncharacterized protein n=1 Tax=Pectinatus cerevisiiphilus TaxID=86956 RepID=A0A4V2USL6_9FIRM|nr:hypothetical protein [Pectinatus cerevisiiphilus]TCS81902.1 hypothetical protein EDC37_10173 [Pectinatus cerevisiiphilus]